MLRTAPGTTESTGQVPSVSPVSLASPPPPPPCSGPGPDRLDVPASRLEPDGCAIEPVNPCGRPGRAGTAGMAGAAGAGGAGHRPPPRRHRVRTAAGSRKAAHGRRGPPGRAPPITQTQQSTIFFPASVPCVAAGTVAAVLTLWESITQAVGSGSRPSAIRTKRQGVGRQGERAPVAR
jgi:hypothetical protein